MNYREGERYMADMSGAEWLWLVFLCCLAAGIVEKMGWAT